MSFQTDSENHLQYILCTRSTERSDNRSILGNSCRVMLTAGTTAGDEEDVDEQEMAQAIKAYAACAGPV